MTRIPRHNVFISYHYEQDFADKEQFVQMMGNHIVDKSVNIGDIVSDSRPTEATLQRIREDHIADASVTIVLIGRCTWKRKYVDWEIGASLRDTATNPRCGLLGILLPSHPNYGEERYDSHLIPPRLSDNCNGNNPFACIYDWPGSQGVNSIRGWIHKAFLRRRREPWPDNSRLPFGRNWRGPCSQGWQS